MIKEIVLESDWNESLRFKSLLYFYADWDPSCHFLSTVIKHLSETYYILRINIENPNLSNKIEELNIFSVPTFIFIEDGIIKDRREGNLSFKDLKKMLT
jgi:thiol-disulfide isomerase/thioredoxin